MTRREAMAVAAGALAGTSAAKGQDPNLTKLWVRFVSGGKPFRPSLLSMFHDPMFVEIQVIPYDHPYNMAIIPVPPAPPAARPVISNAAPVFASDNPPDLPWIPSTTILSGVRPLLPNNAPVFSVLVLNDQIEWPNDARENIQKAVEAGKGIVVLHNALGDNQSWPWWREQVTGGQLVVGDASGLPKSTITASGAMEVQPVGTHPIVRGLSTLRLTGEELYKGVWQSPKITPLLEAKGMGTDRVVAWIGPSEKTRVVCISPGTSSETHRNPVFRELVRNAILWAGHRL